MLRDDKYIILILIEINNLLDNYQKAIAKHLKIESSIKKMISNISHDLKTPLTVILGYAEMLESKDILKQEERKVLCSKVISKTNELVLLINKFFDLAKLESGDKEIKLTKVNLNENCRKNILDFYDTLNNRGIMVNVNIPKENIYVLGNEEAINSVIYNLISNSIKYGYEGKFLEINLKLDDEFAYVEIVDKGKGINEVYKDKIFERLYTLEDSKNKQFQGSGIGLTITKRLIKKMHGGISVSSVPYKKTKFYFKLKKINY